MLRRIRFREAIGSSLLLLVLVLMLMPLTGGMALAQSSGLSLSPAQGPVGTSVTATANGFSTGDSVQVMFDGSGVSAKTSDANGHPALTFSVPQTSPGSHTVMVVGEASGSESATFTVTAAQATSTAAATRTPTPSNTNTPSPTTTPTQGATSTSTATPSATATGTPASLPVLVLDPQSGPTGTQVIAVSGGFTPGDTVQLIFNGSQLDSNTADTGGNIVFSFNVPSLGPGSYQVETTGRQGGQDTASFTITSSATSTTTPASLPVLVLDPQSGPVGTEVVAVSGGFTPGDTVQLIFNGAQLDSNPADTSGNIVFTFAVPNLGPGQYQVTTTGREGGEDTATFTVTGSSTPAATATPTPNATPAPSGGAPAIQHDDRYFSQTGYRIDNDQVWSFFQSNGGIQTFGYPTSRNMTLLGCPVQMFQRLIVQVCPNQGPALINLLDPDIFPYTQVNGSTFPSPDDSVKSKTPPVSDPNYTTLIGQFIQTVVPDTYNGQQVNFHQYLTNQGGLTIWGAPISNPQPDPKNGSFIYQRFQRGIMHYIAGTGTESILLADYLKALVLNQNVPGDLLAQARGSRFYNQYCPNQHLWLCRPNDLQGTDLTYAFEKG